MKAALARLLERVGLLGPLLAVYGELSFRRALRRSPPPPAAEDGLPVPPARLVFLVTHTTDVGWYLESGRRAAAAIEEALARHGVELAAVGSLLDFGCGCGRVIRNWHGLDGVEVHGADYNERLVEWCAANLGFARFAVNGLRPPLPYEDGSFGLVYALSVLTHLPAGLQDAWLAELRRVLAPGGLLLVSTHGAAYRERLAPDELRAFDAGEMVVRRGGVAGTNWCTVFHPEPYVRDRVADGLALLEFAPEGARGNPRQDLTVLQKA